MAGQGHFFTGQGHVFFWARSFLLLGKVMFFWAMSFFTGQGRAISEIFLNVVGFFGRVGVFLE